MAQIEELFTIEELATKWKVHKNFIRKKIRQHELVPENIPGRVIRFSESSINEFLKKKEEL